MPTVSRLHQGAYIILANQKPSLLEMMVEALQRDDHCIFRAYDGLAARDLALSLKQINLLITDTNTPGLRGPELVRELRGSKPELPTLYIKNLESPVNPPGALPPDVGTLAEPFTAEQFLAAVRPAGVRD